MKRFSLAAASLLLCGALVSLPSAPAAAEPPEATGPKVYTAEITPDQLGLLQQEAVDREDVTTTAAEGGKVRLTIILNEIIADKLRKQGIDLREQAPVQARARAAATVFRPYSGPGNIREELLKAAADHPLIAKAVDIGTTLQGKPITAVRVTLGARALPDRVKPAVVYQAAQHAREWITPEMVRRLMHHYLDNYGKDREITKLVNTVDLWFVPVVNVDGYDHTFTSPDTRLWRKNLRDNDGDGVLETGEGVDLNRNFPNRWGYDNEGSSPVPASETFRGTAPASEPETKAQIALIERVRPKFVINWHSAAELLLHGVGWQFYTPSPDDLIHDAILGDAAKPAVPGYVPEIGAQLYTTNGETDGHFENAYGALTQTPEMSTCRTVSLIDPDDPWRPEDCVSGFHFPDDEKLVAAEVAKNIPYALSVAKSAHRPDRPVSAVGRTVPDIDPDEFAVSYSGDQQVAALIRRSLPVKLLHYRINGGRTHTVPVREWKGGERYGDEFDTYFAEYRGTVRGQKPGDKVEVWFTAATAKSPRFAYTVRDLAGAQVLVVADEDYKGVNPAYPPTVTAPKYARQYVDALAAAGRKALVWDVDADGVPHHLGALSHFKGVVWYLGDNRLTQDAADETITVFGTPRRDAQVADRAFHLTLALRDYLNEGGKLLYAGETAAYFGSVMTGGIYYGLKGFPDKPCVVTISTRDDCETLSNDFAQYWLGVSGRSAVNAPTGVEGTGTPLTGATGAFAAAGDNPLNEAGNFTVTSTLLNERDFPLFKSWPAAIYQGRTGPFEPVEGKWYAAARHVNYAYSRLVRTIDLTGVSAAQAPKLEAQLSYNTEANFDHVLVEAHTAGAEDWVTLPDLGGGTTTQVPAECEQGYYLAAHPQLLKYLTPGDPCTAKSWNAFTGNSGGWKKVAFDLSAYAGKKVEVSISYVADPGTGFQGAFVDDTKVTTTGGTLDAEGFETGLGPWTVPGPPPGSVNVGADFTRANSLGAPAVATADSVVLGFGLEQVATPAERDDLMKRIADYLLADPR
ncbi:M14 family metallopeptidase [Thermoactinospora rubra]|uniref:M14 family metallopeptidase n=1 Tax=Thermoactinospora rubra TaxID=1088767 RepID=UPI000A102932|nr:M14 family metallopeptidase [Thermoactinospora rubra]